MKIITLTTDFGYLDPFAGVMKGVIYSICPNVKIVDLTHDISPQDIWKGNYVIKSAYRYFPKGTIHVCVIDPGVGSLRKPILIETTSYFFIGPDNGLFTSIIETENIKSVFELTNDKYFLQEVSQTFHGRDIFAPVAAHLAAGKLPKEFGKEINIESLTKIQIPKLIKDKNSYTGIVQFIDHFGNLITNIPNNLISSKVTGKVKNTEFTGLVNSFGEGEANKLTAIKGSSGYMEIFINKGNAQKLTNTNISDGVELRL